MAQTRTAGKALRSVFAWVAVLAGYSATPAEEMTEIKDDIPDFKPHPAPVKQDKQEQPAQKPAGAMSDKQRGKLWHLCKEAGLTDVESKGLLTWFTGRDTHLTSREASNLIETFAKSFEVWQKEQAQPQREPGDDTDA